MVRDWWKFLRVTYFTVDARSLGAFRVAFGLVLFSDLARRWWELEYWYANSGLLPNHTVLWRPPARHVFSLFLGLSTVPEAVLGFALCGVVYAMFLLGFRTRWAQVLTLVARVSLNSRLAVLENGGDMVMDLLCLLTLPLPLGLRFSLDAVHAQMHETRAGETEERGRVPVVSIAMLALLLQLSAIYLFNAASKNGDAWRDGSAVYYALHQDKLVTWPGVWMREHLPTSMLRLLTWSTLAVEWLGFVLVITPFSSRQARLLAVCVMPCLHLCFAVGLNLGGFSPAMMSYFTLLLGAEQWDGLERRFGGRLRRARDAVSATARLLLARLCPPTPLRPQPLWRGITDVSVVLVLVAIATEVLNDNAPVPRALRLPQPAWAKAVIEYPRILQGWRMFASEPSRFDTMIYVDAVTAAGERVDPYNQVASDQRYPAGSIVPKHMGQSQFFVMYSDRIPNVGYADYRQAFSEWLLAYPNRTSNPRDCLLSYEVFLVKDRTPAFGSGHEPTPLERQSFMTYSAPWDGPCRALVGGAQVSGLN